MSINNPDRFTRAGISSQWQDWANLILAIWLFISPWVLQFAAAAPPPPPAAGAAGSAAPAAAGAVLSNASWNAWVLGVIIFLVAASAISRLQLWQEWVNLVLGIWLFVAPWVLGFSSAPNAAWDHWIVGVLVFICAVWDLNNARIAATATTSGAAPGYAGSKPGYTDNKPERRL